MADTPTLTITPEPLTVDAWAPFGWLPRPVRLALARQIGRLAPALMPAERAATRETMARTAVYAVNTLHVAHDLGFTLAEIRRALRPGGALIVSECVRPSPRYPVYTEFVFHLIRTFRSPRLDGAHRPNGGLLTPPQWQGAIEAAGFADTRFVPDVLRIHRAVSDFFVAPIGATRPA